MEESGTVDIMCSSTQKAKDFKWLIDIAFRYFDMHIGVKYIGRSHWQLFIEEPSLAETYFGEHN